MTLFYQLTEAELNELGMVRGQVALMVDLLGQCGTGHVNIEHVHSFLDGVLDKMLAVTAAVEERDTCRKGLSAEMLTQVLRFAAGEDVSAENMQDLGDQLLQAMQEEPSFAAAVNLFYALMAQRSRKAQPTGVKPAQSRQRRSRAHLAGEGAVA
ncbi:MAG: hypothetical protein KBF33_03835 [Comamonas sp.]|nr:hypothetical protein [Comamonas sp.]